MLFRKTVDGVMAAFHKTIADLQAVEKANLDEAERQTEALNTAMQKRMAAMEEANRAQRIYERMTDIVL